MVHPRAFQKGIAGPSRCPGTAAAEVRRKAVADVSAWKDDLYGLNAPGNPVAIADSIHYGAGFFVIHSDQIDFGNSPFKGLQKPGIRSGACGRNYGISLNGLSLSFLRGDNQPLVCY